MLEPGVILSGLGVAAAAIVWAVRIEGRVNAHQQLFDEREKQTGWQYAEILTRLARVENKLDDSTERRVVPRPRQIITPEEDT